MRRAAAGHRGRVIGALLTPVLQRAVRSACGWRRGERPRARPAPADAERRPRDRQRSHLPVHDGAGHDAVLPRETRPSGEAEAGTLPRLGGAAHLRPVHAEPGLGCKPRGRHAQLAGRSRRRSSAPRASPWISRPSARPPIATLRGPERPSRARRAACWTRDRQAGGRLPRRGPVRVRRKKRGPKTKKGRNRFHTDWKEPKLLILYVSATTGDRLRRGPRSSTARSGDRRRPPSVVVRAADRPQRR